MLSPFSMQQSVPLGVSPFFVMVPFGIEWPRKMAGSASREVLNDNVKMAS